MVRAALSAAVLASAALLSAQSEPADVIFTGGRVVTVDERFTIAEAVAIRGERVATVGSTAAVEALAGPSTQRVDLRGRTVIASQPPSPSSPRAPGRAAVWLSAP